MSWTLWRNSIDSSFNNFYTKNPMSGNINMTAAVAPFRPWADLNSDLISIIAPCCMLRALRSRRDLYQRHRGPPHVTGLGSCAVTYDLILFVAQHSGCISDY